MGKKRWALILISLVVLVGITACGGAPAPREAYDKGATGAQAPAPTAAPAALPALSGYDADTSQWSAVVVEQTDRKVIQTASLKVVVKDTSVMLDFVQGLVERYGGYIVNSNTWRDNDQLRAQVTLRVPSDQLPAALQQIRSQAVKVDSESVTGEDVTQEYTDLESRIRNAKATETELVSLLATVREKTGKAEDILAIYNQLTQIRGEIETLQGRQQYLDTMTAMGTISVDIWPEPLEAPVVEPGWQPLTTMRDASRSLVQLGKAVVEGLIWLVIYGLPVMALIALPFLAIWWIVRRARRNRVPRPQ